jgi:hypothetical protein
MSKKLLISKDELLLEETIDYIKNSFEQIDEPEDQAIGWCCIKGLKKIKKQISKCERSIIPRKDETTFKIGDRVYEASDGFGIIRNIVRGNIFIKSDNETNSEAYPWYFPNIFHAHDECIRIFGVEPETPLSDNDKTEVSNNFQKGLPNCAK